MILLGFLFLMCFAGIAGATSITFTDTTYFTQTGTNANEDLVSYGGDSVNLLGETLGDWVTWAHNFDFDPAASEILEATLVITFCDDDDYEYFFTSSFSFSTGWTWYLDSELDTDDSVKEYALGWGEDWVFDFGEVDSGTAGPYEIDFDYLLDGKYQVTIASSILGGDFYIVQSDLTITYEPVPEPATMLLLGTGLIGLAAGSRKKFFKK